MAIRKSKVENFHINSDLPTTRKNVISALNSGGFTSIKENDVINEFRADYKKLTMYGSIAITLTAVVNGVDLRIEATANVDNVYALFSSPIQKILTAFKDNLKK